MVACWYVANNFVFGYLERTLMGCADPPSVSSLFGSKLPLLLYADVRTFWRLIITGTIHATSVLPLSSPCH